MSSKPLVAIITTTINVPRVLAAYQLRRQTDYDLRIIVAGDANTDQRAHEFVRAIGGEYLGVHDIKSTRWASNEVIGTRSIQRRNLALLHAISIGADYVITVDDDNVPYNPMKHVDEVLAGFANVTSLLTTGTGWYNPNVALDPVVVHRGFTLNQRHKDVRFEFIDVTQFNLTYQVGVVAGLCIGDPDIDAIERIVLQPMVHNVNTNARLPEGVVLAPGTWAPFNTQNTAYTWEVAPLMQCLVDVGRYDDIWMSYVARAVMNAMDRYVRYGAPLMWQERNEHDLVVDLKNEVFGYQHTPAFTEALRDVELPEYNEADPCASVDLLELAYAGVDSFFSERTRNANRAWLTDVREAIRLGVEARGSRDA